MTANNQDDMPSQTSRTFASVRRLQMAVVVWTDAIKVVGVLVCLIVLLPSEALAQGQIDSLFGMGGKVVIDFGGTVARATAVAIQPDGKIVVVGQAQTSSTVASADFAIARFTQAGLLDPTFGVGGKLTTDFFGDQDGANAVALQSDGKIVVGGYAVGAGIGMTFAVARYHANGQLDTSFGTGGKVITSSAPNPYPYNTLDPCQPLGSPALMGLGEITAVAVQPDGRIVVGGNAEDITIGDNFNVNIALVRYQPDGSLDPSLLANTGCPGVNGIRIDNVSSIGRRDYLTSLLVLPDGKILIGGSTEYFKSGQSHAQDSLLIRYQSNGVPDSTFGDSSTCPPTDEFYTCVGVVAVDTHPVYGWIDAIAALALQPDGKVTSVGQTLWTFYSDPLDTPWSLSFALTRHSANGIADAGFGNSGVVNLLLPPDAPRYSSGYGGTAVALDSSGRTVVVGGTSTVTPPSFANPSAQNFAVARFTGNGLLDGVFNGSGFVETDFFGLEDNAMGVAVQADGRIVVVGFANTSATTSKMAIARYEGGGTCTYSASLVFTTYSAAAGFGYANILTPTGCPWTAASNTSWIHMNVTSGSGPRTSLQMFTVDPNPGAGSRSGSVTVAGSVLTLTQGGAASTRIISLSGNLAFGDVLVGTTMTRTLTIGNGGNATLTVNSITYPSGFSGNWAGGTIPAGGSQAVTVTFAPVSPTSYGGTITANGDQTSGTNTRAASGTGTTAQDGTEDLAVDFGAPGIWTLIGSAWSQLHTTSPEAMVRGDLDGDGLDDLVVDFGAAYGVWVWMNHATWFQLHALSPSVMVTGDLDDNARDEVILDFPGHGVWIWGNNTSWAQLHPVNASHLATGNLDGSLGDEVVIDFPGYGIYVYANNTAWTQLHLLSATTILTTDLDGSGRDDVVIDFPGHGLWSYRNNATWGQVHPFSAAHVVAGDLDGTGQADLVIDFGPTYGLWTLRNNTTWAPLHPLTAQQIVLADRDGNGKDEVLIDFGAPYGLWQYGDDTVWSQLHALSPETIAAGRFR